MKKLLIALCIFIFPSLAFAQSQRNPCAYTTANPGSGNGCIPVSAANPLPVGPGGTQIQGNASGSTGAVVATLAADTTGKTTYLCEFDVSAIGGTAAIGPITVAGLSGASRIYQLSSSATGVLLSKSFNPCLPASASNTAITITTTADGTATAVDVNSSGYQR